jgi:hypothetical protein
MSYTDGWYKSHELYQNNKIIGAAFYAKLLLWGGEYSEYDQGFKDGWEHLTI